MIQKNVAVYENIIGMSQLQKLLVLLLTAQINRNGKKDVEIMVPLKCNINFWRTLEMPLINCETNFILTRSKSCAIRSRTTVN